MKRLVVLLCLAVALSLATAEAASAAIAFQPCSGTSGRGLECGTLTVPLDRSGATPGTLSLAVRRVAGSAGSEAVVRLAGGPGEASTPTLRPFAAAFAQQLAGRQVVAVDTRGTGAGAIDCDTSRTAARCAARVGRRLPFLNTTATVEDLEQLRSELGATKLSFVATSYGGKVANEYARRHPASTGFLVLDSPSALAGTDPLDRARQGALRRVLADVCSGGACRGITPSVAVDLTAAVARARAGRLRLDFAGSRKRVTVEDLQQLVATSDLSPFGRAVLPAALHRAAQGDGRLLGRTLVLAAAATDTPEEGTEATGTLLAVVCQESPFPWDPASAPGAGRQTLLASALAGLPPALYSPFGRTAVLASTTTAPCVTWPSVPASPPTAAPAPDTVPVLTLVGTQDLRTPVEVARQLTGEYRLGEVVEVPGAGHSPLEADVTGCATSAVRAFLTSGQAPQCPSTRRLPAPFAPPPASVGAAEPIRGVPGRAGAVTSASLATLDDLVVALAVAPTSAARLAGLRGGTVRIGGGRLRLDGYSSVPGLRLDGTLRTSNAGALTGTVRVSSARGSGTLRLAGRRVTGTIGGRQLTVRRTAASPLAATAAATS